MTLEESRIARFLLARVKEGLRPDALEATGALALLTSLVGSAHGAQSHAPRKRRARPPVPDTADDKVPF